MRPAITARPRLILSTQRTVPVSAPWRASTAFSSLRSSAIAPLLRRVIFGRRTALQIADRRTDFSRPRAIRIAGPRLQNLQPFAIVKAPVTHHIARQPIETAGARFDVFEQFLFRHGQNRSRGQIRPNSASTRTITRTRPNVPDG